MKQLKTFDDLEIPQGLFPEEESFFVRNLALRAIRMLNDTSIQEINEYIDFIEETKKVVSKALESPEMKEISKHQKDAINSKKPISVFHNIESNDALHLQLLEPRLSTNTEYWQEIPKLHEDLLPEVAEVRKHYAVLALTEYSAAIEKANAINEADKDNNNPYYRLGKVYKHLHMTDLLLNIADGMQNEIIGIGQKEQAEQSKRSKTGSEGGSKAHAQKKEVQRELIRQYKEAKGKGEKIVKARFVDKFIENLPPEQRSQFSKTNIARNLADTLRKYDKGTISTNIWPG